MSTAEKLSKWKEKAIKGEEGYALIIRNREGFFYLEDNISEDILSITVIICKKEHFELFFEWDNESNRKNKRDFFIVMKEDKKLMLQDETERLISFGLSDVEDDVEKILILFTTEDVSTIISASKDVAQVDVRHHVYMQTDIMHKCISQIFHNLMEKETNAESEVKENELSDNPIRIESLDE